MREALSANPQLAAGDARVAIAEGQRKQAGLSPNPRLFLQSEDLRPWNNSFSFPNSTEDYGYVSQTVETARKRARRVDVARSGVQLAEYERQLLVRRIQGGVSLAYWNASSLTFVRDLYNESLQTYERDVTYGRNRVAEGQMAEADLIRVELERDRVRAESLSAARTADTALLDLYRAMVRTTFGPVKLVSPIENQPRIEIPGIVQVLARRPELRIAQESVVQTEANTRLQHANAVPDPDFLFGYKRNVGVNTLYAAVQIPLPLFNRNQGNVASAEAQLRLAQADLLSAERSIRVEWESAIRAYRAGLQLLETLPATRARAEETARLAREAYRLGGTDLLRLLDAERVRIDVQIAYYRAFAEFQQSVVNLVLASGQEPFMDGARP